MIPHRRRRSLSLALCAVLLAPLSAAAQHPASEAPRAADLSAELPRLFPASTSLYVEIPHLGSLANSVGIVDRLLELANERLAPPPAPGAKKPAAPAKPVLSAKDLNTLLDASVGLGFLREASMGDTSAAVVVLHMGSSDGPALLHDRVLARFGAPRATVTVHGVDVVRMHGFSYAISGRAVLLGMDDNVDAVLAAAASSGPRLGDEPAFVTAATKHVSGQDQAFVYVAGRGVSALFGGMFGGLRTPDGERKETPAEFAMRNFLGIEAVQGLAAGIRFDPDTTRIRYDLELDRTHTGLVTVLADPPPIAFRSSMLLPMDTERLTVFSVDAARIYDLLEQSFASVPTGGNGRSFTDEVAELEETFGVRMRAELIPAFGTEVAYAGTLDGIFGGAPEDGSSSKRPLSVIVLQVRNPDVVRAAISHALATKPDTPLPSVDYKGAEYFESPGVSAALGKDFMLVGPSADVRRCLDAQADGTVLAKSPEFAARAGGWAGDTILATYESGAYRDATEREFAQRQEQIKKQAGENADAAMFEMMSFSGAITSTIPSLLERDGSGVHWENSIPLSTVGSVAAYALGQMLQSAPAVPEKRDPADTMVGTLYTVSSAEARFREDKDRYASMEELVAEGLVSREELSSSAKDSGYVLTLTPLGTGDGSRFELVATPTEYGKPAKLSFFVDETFVIRAADKGGAPAGANDAPFSYDMSGVPAEGEPPPSGESPEPPPESDPN